jgi:hypothetical protein
MTHEDTKWIEPGFFSRVYYLFVLPFGILASLNMLVLLLFGVDTHYEMLYQISTVAVATRREVYGVLFSVLDALPVSILFGYALVGSLPFSIRFWRFRNTPAGRFLKHRSVQKNKSDVSDTQPGKLTVE